MAGEFLYKCSSFGIRDTHPTCFCAFCRERPAVRACDAKVVERILERWPLTRWVEKRRTCDATLCAECAHRVAPDVDLCPNHRRKP